MGSYNVYRQSEFKDQIAKLERELAEDGKLKDKIEKLERKIRELESKDDNGETASSED
jgi:uncharacterized protein YdcH (DUF465 family)